MKKVTNHPFANGTIVRFLKIILNVAEPFLNFFEINPDPAAHTDRFRHFGK